MLYQQCSARFDRNDKLVTQFVVVLLAPVALCFLIAPTITGTPQRNAFTILGQVSLPDGNPAMRVPVKITGMSGLDRETRTDSQGRYEFQAVTGGRYRLTASNPADPTHFTDPVDADTSRSAGNRLLVHIYLRVAPTVGKGGRKPSVVSAAEAAQNIPKRARKAYEQGLKAKANNDFSRALEDFGSAIEIYPGYFQAFAERGDVHIKQDHVTEAVTDFDQALKINKDYVPALRGIGFCKLGQQKFTESAHYLVRSLEAEFNDASSHLFLGIALLGLNQGQLAKEEFQQALRIDAGSAANARIYLADLYAREQRYKEAADELRTYLAARPTAPNAAKLKDREAQLRILAKKAL